MFGHRPSHLSRSHRFQTCMFDTSTWKYSQPIRVHICVGCVVFLKSLNWVQPQVSLLVGAVARDAVNLIGRTVSSHPHKKYLQQQVICDFESTQLRRYVRSFTSLSYENIPVRLLCHAHVYLRELSSFGCLPL